MAKARKVVGDQNSAELDELRRQFNNLLVIIEKTATFATLQTAIANGVEAVTTKKEIVGVKPTPLHPRRPKNDTLIVLDSGSDF